MTIPDKARKKADKRIKSFLKKATLEPEYNQFASG
jgi:hypothetical protein